MIKMKPILPGRFHEDVFRIEEEREMGEIGRLVETDFDSSVKDWTGARPTFNPLVEHGRTYVRVTITPIGDPEGVQKYEWLVEGTDPHLIQPLGTHPLVFRTGGGRTNDPGRIASSPAAPATGPTIFTTEVFHPGTPEHPIPKLIKERREREVQKRMQYSLDVAARRCGHYYR